MPKTPPSELDLQTLKPEHREPPRDGPTLIYEERVRQLTVKRRTAEADRLINQNGELAMAAACYALLAGGQTRATRAPGGMPDVVAMSPLRQWPWRGAAWKPSNSRLKNLVRAGALIAAEIDRLTAEGETLPAEPEPMAAAPTPAPMPNGPADSTE